MNLGLDYHFCISLDTNTGDCNAADSPDNTNLCYYLSSARSDQADAQTNCQSYVATAVPLENTNAQIQTCVVAGFRSQGGSKHFWTGGIYTHDSETVQWNGKAASSTSHFTWRSGWTKKDGALRMKIDQDPADAYENGMYVHPDTSNYIMCQYPYN